MLCFKVEVDVKIMVSQNFLRKQNVTKINGHIIKLQRFIFSMGLKLRNIYIFRCGSVC